MLLFRDNQFQLLPAYIDAVRAAGPEARIQLGMRRFQRLFICPDVRREALRHRRSFPAVDGAFTKDIL